MAGDPYIHNGSPRQVVVHLLDVLRTTAGNADVDAILRLDRDLCRATRLLKQTYHAQTVFSSAALFKAVVAAASKLASDAGLIRP